MARSALVNIIGVAPWILSLVAAGISAELSFRAWGGLAFPLILGALAFTLTFFLVVCSFGVLTRSKIKPLKIERNLKKNDYFYRALYGRAWTTLYYFKPFYHFVLSQNWLRSIVFSMFGYKGSLNFTLFPDSWIRDLPLLKIGDGAYIANRATIGTNICLKDNTTVVGPISLGERAMVGHLSVVGLGASIEDGAELGVCSIIGIRTKVGKESIVSGKAVINHGVKIGSKCQIGAHSYMGIRSSIADGIILPSATIVPEGKIILEQSDVTQLRSSETEVLNREKGVVDDLVKRFGKHL